MSLTLVLQLPLHLRLVFMLHADMPPLLTSCLNNNILGQSTSVHNVYCSMPTLNGHTFFVPSSLYFSIHHFIIPFHTRCVQYLYI
jgi:hypothetical protein